MNDLYAVPLHGLINVLGFWIESFLACYLLARFFPPRNGRPPSCPELLAVSAGITLALLAVDLSAGESLSYRAYMLTLTLLPLLYACRRLQGGFFRKLLISFLFLLLNTLLESMFVVLQYFGLSMSAYFLFRRILCKPLLYFIIKFLLLNVVRSRLPISNAYWVSLAVICASEYLLLFPVVTNQDYGLSFRILVICFCLFIPLSFYYTITRLIAAMEENRIYLSQNRQLELSQQYLTQAECLSDSLRQFRHDYKAHLFCMDALLSQGKYEELHQYLLKLHQISPQALSVTQYTLNSPLNIVLNQKAGDAQRCGIPLRISAVYPDQSSILDIDLVTLVSNLLDNALEAAAAAPQPMAAVDIRQEKAYLRIEVVNATAGDVLKANPGLITTKADHNAHGLGLKIVRNLVERYEGLYQVSGDGSSFRTVILLSLE